MTENKDIGSSEIKNITGKLVMEFITNELFTVINMNEENEIFLKRMSLRNTEIIKVPSKDFKRYFHSFGEYLEAENNVKSEQFCQSMYDLPNN